MRRLMILSLICCIVLFSGSSALAVDPYNEPMSVYAALHLVSVPDGAVFVNPGTYAAGSDIPFGIYRIDAVCYGCAVRFNYPDIKNAYNLFLGKNFDQVTIMHLPFIEGSSITIEHNGVYFTPVEYNVPDQIPFTLETGLYFPGKDFPAGIYSISNGSDKPANLRQHKMNFLRDTVRFSDVANNTKVEFTDDTYISLYNSPIVVSEYVSPFSR